MRKILFAALNSSWSQSNLAFYYLREMIRDLDYESILRSYTLKEPLMQVMEDIYRQQADVICFSAYIWNRLFLQSLHRELLKILPETIFVIGGPEAVHFKNIRNTIVIEGAGEAAFRELAISNFSLQDCGHSNPDPLPLNKIPFPYRDEDKADLEDHLLYYESYRGCPYRCAYCLSANDQRQEARFDLPKDTKLLYQELDALCRLRPRTIKFIDRSFNVQKALAHAIWQYAIEFGEGQEFHFEIYPDLLDEQDLQILEQMPEGRIRFEIGIQSINRDVLKTCGRNSAWEKSKSALIALKERTKIRIHADLIAGLPKEDYASVLRSLNELCKCEPAAVQLGSLKILADTPMQEIAESRGYLFLDNPPYQVLASDALSYEEMRKLDNFAHLLNLYWNKEEYPQLWHELLQKYSASQILTALKD
ncbi:MAG: DUF4080 domain-containing protein, partial [Candidatus Cloacimonetes bacterium]|nr:DUF4080 domain-containing protein [Candidatus Cloacimonadota bacterium]